MLNLQYNWYRYQHGWTIKNRSSHIFNSLRRVKIRKSVQLLLSSFRRQKSFFDVCIQCLFKKFLSSNTYTFKHMHKIYIPQSDNNLTVWWCREILLRCSGFVVMMRRPRNHAWTQSHHLRKALLEVMLLYKHQLLYDTCYIYVCVCVCVIGESSDDFVVNVLDCDIVVRELKLLSCFLTNSFGKGMNPLISFG